MSPLLKKSGFTLMELLISVALVSILTISVIDYVTYSIKTPLIANQKAQLITLHNEIIAYLSNERNCTNSFFNLNVTVNATGLNSLNGFYPTSPVPVPGYPNIRITSYSFQNAILDTDPSINNIANTNTGDVILQVRYQPLGNTVALGPLVKNIPLKGTATLGNNLINCRVLSSISYSSWASQQSSTVGGTLIPPLSQWNLLFLQGVVGVGSNFGVPPPPPPLPPFQPSNVFSSMMRQGRQPMGQVLPNTLLDVTGNTGISGAINVGGNIFSNNFIATSDINLKYHIKKIDHPLLKIKNLEGISFYWKGSTIKNLGLIAQDVEKIFPEIVETIDGKKSISYFSLIAPLIESHKSIKKDQDLQFSEMKQLKEKNALILKALSSNKHIFSTH